MTSEIDQLRTMGQALPPIFLAVAAFLVNVVISRLIATERAKLDPEYQYQIGYQTGPAKDLSPELRAKIVRYAKRICRTLEIDGYCRIDFRLSKDGVPYFIEANPNPEISAREEFAQAALRDHDQEGKDG